VNECVGVAEIVEEAVAETFAHMRTRY
jgi:hypothetical protein